MRRNPPQVETLLLAKAGGFAKVAVIIPALVAIIGLFALPLAAKGSAAEISEARITCLAHYQVLKGPPGALQPEWSELLAREKKFASLGALDLDRSIRVWGGNSFEPAAMTYRGAAIGQAGVMSRSIKDALATDRSAGAGSEGKAVEILRAFAQQILTCEKEVLAEKQANCAADYRLLALVYKERGQHMVPRASQSLRNAVENSMLKSEEEITAFATNGVRRAFTRLQNAEGDGRKALIDETIARARNCEELLGGAGQPPASTP